MLRPSNRKYVAKVTTLVFNLAVRFKILTPWTDIESSGAYSAVNGQGTPGGARAEAERRRCACFRPSFTLPIRLTFTARVSRAMALQALDKRMASKPSTSASGSGAAPGSQTSSPRQASVASLAGQPIAGGSGTGGAGETIEMERKATE